jgi:hypothetical protein
VSEAEWQAEGERLYGPDVMKWRFRCPVCGNVASVEDFCQFKAQGATPDCAYQECIGRWLPDCASNLHVKPARDGSKAPCDYCAYGLFRLGNVVTLESGKETHVFPFADQAA